MAVGEFIQTVPITEDRKRLCRELVAIGATNAYIAYELKITEEELEKYYKEELIHGLDDANVKVAMRLYSIATTGEDKVALQAIKYWLSIKAGWREPPKELEVSGKNGKDLNFPDRASILADLAGAFNGQVVKSN